MGAAAASAPIEGIASEYVHIVQGEDGETYAVLNAELVFRPDRAWHG